MFTAVPFNGFPATAVTVMAWVRPTVASHKTIFAYATPTTPGAFVVAMDASLRIVVKIAGETWYSNVTDSNLIDGSWCVGCTF